MAFNTRILYKVLNYLVQLRAIIFSIFPNDKHSSFINYSHINIFILKRLAIYFIQSEYLDILYLDYLANCLAFYQIATLNRHYPFHRPASDVTECHFFFYILPTINNWSRLNLIFLSLEYIRKIIHYLRSTEIFYMFPISFLFRIIYQSSKHMVVSRRTQFERL